MPSIVRRSSSFVTASVAILVLATAAAPVRAQAPGLTQRYQGAGTVTGSIPTLPGSIPVTATLGLEVPSSLAKAAAMSDGDVFLFEVAGDAGGGQIVPFKAFDIDNVQFLPGTGGDILVQFTTPLRAEFQGLVAETPPIPFSGTVNPNFPGHLHSTGGPYPIILQGQSQPVGDFNDLDTVLGPACISDDITLCLGEGRFMVQVDWGTDTGTGMGNVVPFGSDDSGLFYFFNPNNWEMLIKVLDGCPVTTHFWVFAAATTSVEYTIRVTDTANGTVKDYFNPLGTAAAAITDTQAFATCP